jgi:hypothetical protein
MTLEAKKRVFVQHIRWLLRLQTVMVQRKRLRETLLAAGRLCPLPLLHLLALRLLVSIFTKLQATFVSGIMLAVHLRWVRFSSGGWLMVHVVRRVLLADCLSSPVRSRQELVQWLLIAIVNE